VRSIQQRLDAADCALPERYAGQPHPVLADASRSVKTPPRSATASAYLKTKDADKRGTDQAANAGRAPPQLSLQQALHHLLPRHNATVQTRQAAAESVPLRQNACCTRMITTATAAHSARTPTPPTATEPTVQETMYAGQITWERHAYAGICAIAITCRIAPAADVKTEKYACP